MPKKEKVEQMFDNIAGSYDSLNHIMSLNVDKIWRRIALKRIITPGKPQQIMDLACGTGDFSIAIAKSMDKRGHITGVDLSEGMLAVMKEKVASEHLESLISTQKGEAEGLNFPDGSFDAVTIAFGIRNFEQREDSLRECLRVLKPGGRLVILELSVPANPLLRWFYNLYFTKVMPLIGGRISGDNAAYKYLPASVLAFPGKKEWMQTMQKCGFSQVTHRALTFGICRLYTGTKL